MLTTILFFVMAVMLFRHLRWRFRRHWVPLLQPEHR